MIGTSFRKDHKTAGLRAVNHRMVCSWLMMGRWVRGSRAVEIGSRRIGNRIESLGRSHTLTDMFLSIRINTVFLESGWNKREQRFGFHQRLLRRSMSC